MASDLDDQLLLNYCDSVIYAVVEGEGALKFRVPSFTLPLFSWEEEDPVVKSHNHISDVAMIFDTGHTVNNVKSTGLNIEVPHLSKDHIFVVLPLAWDSDMKTLIRYIFVIQIDEDSSIYRSQIESHLLKLDHSLRPFQSIRNIPYSLNIHRRGYTTPDFTLPNPNEYTAGAILFLEEVFIDELDEEDEVVSDFRFLLRDTPSDHKPHRFGSQLIAVLPSSTQSTVLDDYPSDYEELHNDYRLTKGIKVREQSDKEESVEPLEETLTRIQDAEHVPSELVLSTRKQQDNVLPTTVDPPIDSTLTVQQDNVLPTTADPPIDHTVPHAPATETLPIPASNQNPEESISPQTTLSTVRSSNSYVYPTPISITDKESYYQPSIPGSSSSRQQYISLSTRSPLAADVHNEHYTDLPLSITDYCHGHILYARDSFSKILPSGKYGDIPKIEDLNKSKQLGKGGNGQVYKSFINETEVALKYTKYRKHEIDICRKLCHRNIVPILGVVVVDGVKEKMCCQIMPCMKGSLRDELRSIGGSIEQALKSNALSEDNLQRTLPKILCYILKGLEYLYDKNIVIQDLKDSNILIYKICKCDNVYVCDCCPGYSVELSDFDSVCMSNGETYRECGVHANELTMKSLDHCAKVLGTGEHRAPEKFLELCNCKGVVIIGPWTDIWSFGVFIINQLHGINSDQRARIKREANLLSISRTSNNNPLSDVIGTRLKANELLFGDSKFIKDVVGLASKCFQADCRQRPTPKQLLNDPLLSPFNI